MWDGSCAYRGCTERGRRAELLHGAAGERRDWRTGSRDRIWTAVPSMGCRPVQKQRGASDRRRGEGRAALRSRRRSEAGAAREGPTVARERGRRRSGAGAARLGVGRETGMGEWGTGIFFVIYQWQKRVILWKLYGEVDNHEAHKLGKLLSPSFSSLGKKWVSAFAHWWENQVCLGELLAFPASWTSRSCMKLPQTRP